MHSALFVAHENMTNAVLLEHLVINGKHGSTRVAEDNLHALIFQAFYDHFCAGHLTCHIQAPFQLRFTHKKTPDFRGRMGLPKGFRYRPMRLFLTMTTSSTMLGAFLLRLRDIRSAG